MLKNGSTIDDQEVAKFTLIVDEWWDKNGKFKPLHQFNPVRITYIIDMVKKYLPLNDFTSLKLLDIGCGGGLLSEPMAQAGFQVTALDASAKNIEIAKIHATKMGLQINYVNQSLEELALATEKFDIILNMEVVEHVADVEKFLQLTTNLLSPNGLLFVATLNKTIKSYALAIIGAEYILKWLPKGTHNWQKFLTPAQINHLITQNNQIKLKEMTGIKYHPITRKWVLTDGVDVNYLMVFGGVMKYD